LAPAEAWVSSVLDCSSDMFRCMWELSWGESAQERNQCESNDSNDEKIIEIFTLLDLNDAGRINEDEAKHGKWLVSDKELSNYAMTTTHPLVPRV